MPFLRSEPYAERWEFFMHYLALILQWIFFIGLAGSFIVALTAFIGDLHVFFDDDKKSEASAD